MDLILASQSATRRRILNSARMSARFMSPQIDEINITKSLSAEQAAPRDIADTLAEHKALKNISFDLRHPYDTLNLPQIVKLNRS